ncbi:glutamate racemase [Granulosicoccaceae sp. 1_MG-2023]|nr:glutamate racemase [Granulosicoccaceae sp. 1_MG-2023]
MSSNTILFFDSGIGGLSVVKEARVILPELHYVYVADDAAFPYGDWPEQALLDRLSSLFGSLLARFRPALVVIACNTASTLAIKHLREQFPQQCFVGTVPAIKPAAERTRSAQISVLATPGTVKRQYTRTLIEQYASRAEVTLVAAAGLAGLAEAYMRSGFVDEDAVREEIAPCFVGRAGQGTDIVVLACTHFPFLVNRMRKVAPWPVDWIDTSEAIARRAQSLIRAASLSAEVQTPALADVAVFTSDRPDAAMQRLMRGFGFARIVPFRQAG